MFLQEWWKDLERGEMSQGMPCERETHPSIHDLKWRMIGRGQIHRGQIWFESEEGKGSTFHVRLPLMTDQDLGEIGVDG